MIIPSLKCVAWNARLLVVGFAAGTIENVSIFQLFVSNVLFCTMILYNIITIHNHTVSASLPAAR